MAVLDIAVAIIKMVFIIGIILWILFVIGWVIYRMFFTPDRRAWLKFKIMKKPYAEEDVAWCMEAAEKNLKVIDIKKHCLLNNISKGRTAELCFIFNEVERELKGGLRNNGRSKESHGKVELPKIN